MACPTHIVAVGGLIKDGNGNVLIGKSIGRKNWEFFGGQVEIGENLEGALIREVKEETGLDIKVICLAGIYSNVKSSLMFDNTTSMPTKVMLDFICEYISGEPCDSNETSDVHWVTEKEAQDLVIVQPMAMRLSNLLNFTGRIAYAAYETKPNYIEHYKRYI